MLQLFGIRRMNIKGKKVIICLTESTVNFRWILALPLGMVEDGFIMLTENLVERRNQKKKMNS